jgi:uncharacterized protein (PEP-CTERM system associated)
LIAGSLGLVTMASSAQEVGAQDATARGGFVVEPSVSLRETLTSNVRLSSSNPRSDLVTELTPRVRLSNNSGRLTGYVDYSLRGLLYARESSSNDVQQALSAQGKLEAIEDWAYVDAYASVSQQNVSALGSRSSDNALINSNRTEVSSYRVSPYVRGRLGGFATYEARWIGSSTSSQQGSVAESTSEETSLVVSSDSSTFGRMGWSLDASQQTSKFGNRNSRQSERFNGTLLYSVTPELRLLTRAGRESNDLATLKTQQYTTWGFGGTWRPSERTTLDATHDHRFFGNGYNVRFEHRTPRTVWTFANSQDVNTSGLGNGGVGQATTVFDLLFKQFESVAPDPVQRTALVDAFLQNFGLTRATLAPGGFLSSTASIQRNKRFSFALLGLRSTLLFSAFRNDNEAVDRAASGVGDLSNGNVVHQRGFSINASHRLTPQSALSMDFSILNNRGDLGNNQLGPDVDLSLTARRSLFDSTNDPYNESALVANLRVRF